MLLRSSGTGSVGIVVLQEWWGLNQQICEEAALFAERVGAQVVVPDLYRGKATDDREEAGHLMQGLDWEGAVLDIKGAADFLRSKGCQRVGVTGFCMGGALTLASLAKLGRALDAGAAFYGIPGASFADVTLIKAPVMAHFGELDAMKGFSSPDDARALEKRWDEAGVSNVVYVYANADHAFTNHKSPKYNKEVAEQALARTFAFFQRYLL